MTLFFCGFVAGVLFLAYAQDVAERHRMALRAYMRATERRRA